MSNRIYEAFDTIHADEKLKNATKEYIASKMSQNHTVTHRTATRRTAIHRTATHRTDIHQAATHHTLRYSLYAMACAAVIFVVIFGRWLYFTPVSVISVDINPSIELEINRFDRVISVKSYNDDGKELAKSLGISNMQYVKAINSILENETVIRYMSDDGFMSIVVVGDDEGRCARMKSDIERCTGGHANTDCHSAYKSELSDAHACGLSYGKYYAFLELCELYPDITENEVKDMTMREIQDMIHCHEKESSDCNSYDGHETEHETEHESECESGYEWEHEKGHDREHGNGHHGGHWN